MSALFDKAVLFTDIHFGRSGNSPVANQDNLEFLAWMIERARSWGAKTCFMLGDWHDNRHSLHVSTLFNSLTGMEMLSKAFDVVIFIPGNHDLFYRDRRDIASIEFGRNIKNLKIVREPTTVGDVTLLPWLVGDEPSKIKNINSRYILAHLEVAGFLMNSKVAMPEGGNTPKPEQFDRCEYVFTGHFHPRQAKGRVVYIGNVMPFNFSDAHDDARGMTLLEYGKDPIFETWPDQPVFRTGTLSQLLADPTSLVMPKASLRINVDTDMSYEEAQGIKDTLINEFALRRLDLIGEGANHADGEIAEEVVFQSVDQMVVESLKAVESVGLNVDRLIEIYNALVTTE